MFYDNYIRLCNKVNKSPSAVAEEMGLKRSVVTAWKKGRQPRNTTLEKVADYFGISAKDLISEETKKSPPVSVELTDEEMQIVLAYRKADEKSREFVLLALKDYMESVQSKTELSESVS